MNENFNFESGFENTLVKIIQKIFRKNDVKFFFLKCDSTRDISNKDNMSTVTLL